MKIPVIDIGSLKSGDSGSIKAMASNVHRACTEHGFFYVENHGVSVELQNKLQELSLAFFELPVEEKLKIRMQLGGSAWRGYFPVGDELTSGKPDQKEGIYFGKELSNEHPKVKSNTPLHGKNLYPQIDGFADIIEEYMTGVEAVGKAVLEAIALSLDIDRHYFQNTITNDPTILFRIFHYPAQRSESQTWGVGEHTDYGLLTILKQDDIGGLQIKSNNNWIDAPVLDNTFVCNIGDMLDRMTGGLYRSTPHRVLNNSGKSRISFPLFYDPNFDVEVNPIAGLTGGTDYSSRWDNEDVYNFEGKYGDYLVGKVARVFPKLFEKI